MGVRLNLCGTPHLPFLMAVLRTSGMMVVASLPSPLVLSVDRMLEAEVQLNKVYSEQSYSVLVEPPKWRAQVIVTSGLYDKATSRAGDIVWKNWRDLGLIEGKDRTKRSRNTQQASGGNIILMGDPPETVVGRSLLKMGRVQRNFWRLGDQRGRTPESWQCCSAAEQGSLGQRTGKAAAISA